MSCRTLQGLECYNLASDCQNHQYPSWFRAKRNVELKQAKAKISQPKTGKRKKTK